MARLNWSPPKAKKGQTGWSPFPPPAKRVTALKPRQPVVETGAGPKYAPPAPKAKPVVKPPVRKPAAVTAPVGSTAASTPAVDTPAPAPASSTPAPHIATSKPRKKVPAYGGGKVTKKKTTKKVASTGNGAVDPIEALLTQLIQGSGVNARQAVQAQLAPFMAQFQAGMRQQTTSEAQRRAALQGFTQSLMRVLQGDVAGVEHDYANAESQIGALSSAASQSFAAQNPNAQDQALLAAVNAPIGQQAALGAQNQSLFGQGANTLAYLGGTLPREYLTQAGLAQLAYTRALPRISALAGTQAFKQQQQAFSTERQKLQGQRQTVLAQIPGLIQKVQAQNASQRSAAINSLLGYRTKEQALALNREIAAQTLGLKGKTLDLQIEKTKADVALKSRSLDLQTARVKLQALRDQNSVDLALKRLGISDRAQGLRELEFEWKLKHPAHKGGFTASQKARFRGEALAGAEQMFHGFTPDPSSGDPNPVPHPALTYEEAVLEMQKQGIPLSIALPALNRFYGNTGERKKTAAFWNSLTHRF